MVAPPPLSRKRWLTLALAATLFGAYTPSRAEDDKLDPTATREFAVAVGLQARQLYEQAEKRWHNFIRSYPNDPRLAQAHHHLGACQLRRGKHKEAADTFRNVLRKFPKFKSLDAAQFNLALALYNIGLKSDKPEDLKTAAAAFAEVPEKFPKSTQAAAAWYYRGECLYAADDLAGAADSYKRIIAKHADSDLLADAYYALGTTQQEQSQDKEAETTFRAFLDKFPKSEQAGECRLRLGQSLAKQKKYPEAEEIFAKLVKTPDFPFADFALMQQAECLYAREKFPQSAALYQSLPGRFAKSKYRGAAWLAAGKCWYQAGKYPQAQAALSKAADKQFAEAAEASYWLGQTLLKRDKAAEAVAALDRAIADHPKSDFLPEIIFTRINALQRQPQQRKATVGLFAEFAAKYPDHKLTPKALYMAALTALNLDDFPAAQKHASAFLGNDKFARHELTPDVLFVAGECCLNGAKGNPSNAERHYRLLVKEHPKHRLAPQARVRVGLCLYLAKKHDEATAHLGGVLPALKDKALQAEAHFLIGRSAADAGKEPQAIASFRKALQADPKWQRGDEVLLALSLSLRNQNDLDEAGKQLRRLNRDYPKSTLRPQALCQLGEIAHERQKYDEALGHYAKLLEQFAKHDLAPVAQYGIGLSWFAKKDYNQSVQQLTKLLTAHAGSAVAPKGKYLRGLAYQRLKQYRPAAADLSAFLESKPPQKDALDARYALGLCRAGMSEHEKAAATLAALLRDKPDYARADRACYEMAFALLQLKKEKEAAAAFRKLATQSPDSPLAPESWFRVGEFHEKAGELPQAAQAYAAGLAKAKDAALREKLCYKLGHVEYQRKRYAEAATALLAQIKEHPKGELAHDAAYLAGDSLFRQDKFTEALPLFQRIIDGKAKKYLARALYRGGACLAALKRWPESEKRYSELIEQFPKFELIHEARYGLGFALQNQQKLDEARAAYKEITKATTTETAAKASFMIGECFFAQKKYKEATEQFLEAALGYPYEEWQALGYFEAGRCFIELKETAKARDALETVVKKYPKHPRAKDAAKLLADLKQ